MCSDDSTFCSGVGGGSVAKTVVSLASFASSLDDESIVVIDGVG